TRTVPAHRSSDRRRRESAARPSRSARPPGPETGAPGTAARSEGSSACSATCSARCRGCASDDRERHERRSCRDGATVTAPCQPGGGIAASIRGKSAISQRPRLGTRLASRDAGGAAMNFRGPVLAFVLALVLPVAAQAQQETTVPPYIEAVRSFLVGWGHESWDQMQAVGADSVSVSMGDKVFAVAPASRKSDIMIVFPFRGLSTVRADGAGKRAVIAGPPRVRPPRSLKLLTRS